MLLTHRRAARVPLPCAVPTRSRRCVPRSRPRLMTPSPWEWREPAKGTPPGPGEPQTSVGGRIPATAVGHGAPEVAYSPTPGWWPFHGSPFLGKPFLGAGKALIRHTNIGRPWAYATSPRTPRQRSPMFKFGQIRWCGLQPGRAVVRRPEERRPGAGEGPARGGHGGGLRGASGYRAYRGTRARRAELRLLVGLTRTRALSR